MNGQGPRSVPAFNQSVGHSDAFANGQPTGNASVWLRDFQTRFETVSQACAEVALGFQHLRNAIEDMQTMQPPNLGNLMDQVMGFQYQTSLQQLPTPPSMVSGMPISPFRGFVNQNEQATNSTTLGRIVIKVEDDDSPSLIESQSPRSQSQQLGTWDDDERRNLNEEFIRYFERRKMNVTVPITHKSVADEIIALCATPPPLNHLDRQVGRYLRRHTLPKDPIVLNAMQEWVEKEIREKGKLPDTKKGE